jgi:hypothetical protein
MPKNKRRAHRYTSRVPGKRALNLDCALDGFGGFKWTSGANGEKKLKVHAKWVYAASGVRTWSWENVDVFRGVEKFDDYLWEGGLLEHGAEIIYCLDNDVYCKNWTPIADI